MLQNRNIGIKTTKILFLIIYIHTYNNDNYYSVIFSKTFKNYILLINKIICITIKKYGIIGRLLISKTHQLGL